MKLAFETLERLRDYNEAAKEYAEQWLELDFKKFGMDVKKKK
jgi:hypothetical protein